MPDEPVLFPPKKVPTQVKHWILERYLSAWGGIIVNSNSREVRLSFVDTCCGSGLYHSADKNAEGTYELGSALIGPLKLRELVCYAKRIGRPVRARALLVNDDVVELRTAEKAIHAAGIGDGVDIEFVAERLVDVESRVLANTTGWFSFVFIDPYGPSPTPFSVVAEIVRGQYTDTLINFPFFSFHKWTGFLDKKARNQDEESKLAAADAFMNGREWRNVVEKARRAGTPLEDALVRHYLEALTSLGVHALALPLWFEDRTRVLYHLIFTSHNVAGLAAAKKEFLAGETKQFSLRRELETRRSGMGFLFDGLEANDDSADIAGLAAHLHARFAGQRIPFETVVLEGLGRPMVLEGHVKRALTKLKAKGLAKYPDARYRTPIEFAKSPGPSSRL